MEHLEAEVTGLLGLLEELASNLPPGPFSPKPDLLGEGEWLRWQRDVCYACHLGSLVAECTGDVLQSQAEHLSLQESWLLGSSIYSPHPLAAGPWHPTNAHEVHPPVSF